MKTNPNDLLSALQKKSVSYDENGREIIHISRSGLTKREYFAAMAMQGMLSDNGYLHSLANEIVKNGDKIVKIKNLLVRDSCSMADALIEELNK